MIGRILRAKKNHLFTTMMGSLGVCFGAILSCSGTISDSPQPATDSSMTGDGTSDMQGASGSGTMPLDNTASAGGAGGSPLGDEILASDNMNAGSPSNSGGTGGAASPNMQGMAGSSMNGPSRPDEPEAVCDAVTEVLIPSCGGSGCHQGVGIGEFALGVEEAESYVGQSPVSNVASCGLMIDPDNPNRSMILTKVTGQAPYNADDCKQLMPPLDPLPQSQVDCLRSWLQQFQR